jgi:hypothetical protein
MSKYSVYLGIYPIVLAWYFNQKYKLFYTLGLITSISNHFTRDYFNKKNEKFHSIFVLLDRSVLLYGLFIIENNKYILLKYLISFIYLSSKLSFFKKNKEELHTLSHALISGYILIQISSQINNQRELN